MVPGSVFSCQWFQVSLGCITRSGVLGPGSVWVEQEARKGAVLVVVSSVGLAAIQLDIDLVPGVKVQDHTVAGVVIVLIGVLGNGARPDLPGITVKAALTQTVNPSGGVSVK